MRSFFEALPQTITVSGKQYSIAVDFRTWAMVDRLLTEQELAVQDKIAKLLTLCFPGKVLPDNMAETVSALFDFYACKGVFSEHGGKREMFGRKQAPILSVTYDAPYLYAAIFAQYGVDLLRENPHWFSFCAMVKGLVKEHTICKIMGYRSADLSKIKDKQERKAMAALKRQYRLPDLRSEDALRRETADGFCALFDF